MLKSTFFLIFFSLKITQGSSRPIHLKTIQKVLIFSHYELVSHIKCHFLKFALFFQIFPYCECRKEFHFFTVTCQPPLFSFFLGNLQGSQKIFETGVWSGLLGFGQYGNHGGFLHIERHTRRRSKYYKKTNKIVGKIRWIRSQKAGIYSL